MRTRAAIRGTVLALAAGWLAVAGLGGPLPGAAPAAAQGQDSFLAIDAAAPELAVRVVFAAGRPDKELPGRRLLAGFEEIYVPTYELAGVFSARRSWQEPQRRLTFRAGERSFRLAAESRLVGLDDGETLLRMPVLAHAGDLWVPVEFVTRVLGPGVREAVRWDAGEQRLEVGNARVNVTGLRLEEMSRATALHFECSEPLSFRSDSAEPGVVTLKIYGGQADLAAISRDAPQGLVEAVEARQHADHALIAIRCRDPVASYRSYAAGDGREIVVVLEEEQLGLLPEPTPRGRFEPVAREPLAPAARVLEVKTVVLDPGHGGQETGRIGPRGTLEKDVNLAVARALKRWLERQDGLRVVLTRDEDADLPLSRRAEIANQAGGNLFLSIHCNGWFNQRATGVETYFLSPAKTEFEASAAREENAAEDDDLAFILWDLVQNGFINESGDLAEIVQASLCEALGAENRGVKQAGFRVLVGAYMPAVLIELGFLSNPDEERKLTDPEHQQLLARTIGQSILEFKARYAGAAAASGDGAPDTGGGESGEPAPGGRDNGRIRP